MGPTATGFLPSSGLGNIGAAVGSPNSPGAGPNFGSFGGMALPPPATPFAGTQLPTGNAGISTGTTAMPGNLFGQLQGTATPDTSMSQQQRNLMVGLPANYNPATAQAQMDATRAAMGPTQQPIPFNAPGGAANASPMHASGLPNQAPGGIHPQLWSSILSHLQQTNFRPQHGAGGAPPAAPARWAPLPSMMPQRGGGGTSFMGYR
jgi:hypothetical protein